MDFILATPPCQGVSLIGKNKSNSDMIKDPRNFLIFHVFDIIDTIHPKIVVFENVDRFLDMRFPFENGLYNIEYIIRKKYGSQFSINVNVYNAMYYGVPQSRKRTIIVMTTKNYIFTEPKKQKIITVREAIGSLPSLEAGQKSNIKNHNARNHIKAHIICMQHTPTGHSAFENKIYFPKKKNGERLKGYLATYKRIEWDKPAPTITMRNDAISSQSNVHPGRLLPNGLYSDARVLTLRELFILSSMNPDLDVPSFASDIQIRSMVGEAIFKKEYGIELKEIEDPNKFEKFDFEVPNSDGIYIDFKLWSTDSEENGEKLLEKAQRKLESINGKKAFIVNIICSNDNLSIKDNGKICRVPNIVKYFGNCLYVDLKKKEEVLKKIINGVDYGTN